MGCCNSCDEGVGCDAEKSQWRRMEPEASHPPGPADTIESTLSLGESPREGVWFTLEPGSPADVARKLSLATSEANVSQFYELGDCNLVRVELVTFVLDATDIAGTKIATVTLESSIDRENWRPESQVTISGSGYATWAARGISSRFVRLRYLGGSDNSFNSVHAVTLTGTHGPRWSRGRSGAA